jgi:protein-tyrosine phosphatase
MAIPSCESSWITDRLKAGRNPLTADDVRQLADDGITHVVDLREPREWTAPWEGQDALDAIAERGIVRLNLPVEDVHPPTLETLDAAVAFIASALARPDARVYVHCRAGMERTAGVLVAWRAAHEREDYDTALEAVRAQRPVLCPLPRQEDVVREWIRTRVLAAV